MFGCYRFATMLSLLACLMPSAVMGQQYPSKPIRIIVPYPPGGALDVTARAIAVELSKRLDQTVVVENRAGAGGNQGSAEVARSAPDGYTLLAFTSAIHAINPVLYAKMPFDPAKDLSPVAALVLLNNVLVVHPSVTASSTSELIALAKSQPGKLTYASSGSGTTVHLSGELFKLMAGVDLLHVPYKGSAPAMSDLLGGHVNLMFENIPAAAPLIRSGKLRALGVTGAKRSPLFPEVPTIAEAGLNGYVSTVMYGLVAPAGTPKAVIDRLNSAAIQGANSKEFRERLEPLGYEIIAGTPEAMAEILRTETSRWAPVIKASGARAD
jgi:tripartite-type tricarboxylate transporter receptor subunit TctC